MESLPHVDRPARGRAAELIRKYIDGEIPGGGLHEAWPSSEKDHALHGIGREILPQIRGGRLSDEYAGQHREHIRRILERCELFLRTEMPYGWGNLGLGSCVSYGCAVVVLIAATGATFAILGWSYVGLALLVLTVIVAFLSIPTSGFETKENLKKVRAMADGKLKHWPFEFEEDLAAVKEGKHPLEPAADALGYRDEDLSE